MNALPTLDDEGIRDRLHAAHDALRVEQRWKGTPLYDADRVEDAQAEIAALMDELTRRRLDRVQR